MSKYFTQPIWDFSGVADTMFTQLTPILLTYRAAFAKESSDKLINDIWDIVSSVDMIKDTQTMPDKDFLYREFVNAHLLEIQSMVDKQNEMNDADLEVEMKKIICKFYQWLSQELSTDCRITKQQFVDFIHALLSNQGR